MKKNYWGNQKDQGSPLFSSEPKFVKVTHEGFLSMSQELAEAKEKLVSYEAKFNQMNDFNMATMDRQRSLIKKYESGLRNRTIWINILTIVCVTVIIVAIWTS